MTLIKHPLNIDDMSAVATTVPPKGLGSIQWKDFLKGLYYAIIGNVIYLVSFFISSLLQETPHFPTWAEWLPYIKGIAAAFGGYIVGKLGVNNVGQIFQKDKQIVHVDANDLKELENKAAGTE